MSRILIIYYSRSNATRKLAEELAKDLGADIVAIRDRRSRSGAKGYLRSLWEASRSTLSAIEPLQVDPARYDLVLLGTPVWAARAACPMRRFLHDAAYSLPATAYFCTYGGRGADIAFSDISQLAGKSPVATLAVRRSDLLHDRYTKELDRFAAKLAMSERWRDAVTPMHHETLPLGR